MFHSIRTAPAYVILAVVVVACGQRTSDTVTLHEPDSTICHQAPILIHLRAGGGFALNTEPKDSSALAAWLQRDLPQLRKEGERAVFVQIDSGRAAELPWVVAGIERAGARAYRVVPTCEYTIS